MPPNRNKPMPSERAQRVVAGATWALVSFLGMTALALFVDVPILWWIVSSVVTMALVVWAMDRKARRDKALGE